ncbi:PIN domain-containing protein [Ruaniaceae bacterium KH17]|nr:PIN domain-containing protein [Ruaniaceae bacterium KH17]
MKRACDTSILVPTLVTWHEKHESAAAAFSDVTVIPAHVAMETYSVLTRLPVRQRVAPDLAAAAIAALRRETIGLSAGEQLELIPRLAALGISGGAAYDGMIGVTAARHACVLVTGDRRAARTYDAVGADCQFI